MKVIVSDKLEDKYENYKLVRGIEGVLELDGIDVLIIHSYQDATDFDIGVLISNLYRNGVSSFIYINENPTAVISTVIQGVNGDVYTDEFYLESEEDLDYLLENLGIESKNTQLAVSSAKIIKDFIGAFTRNEERIHSKVYLEQVSQAVTKWGKLTHIQENKIMEMGETAIEVFERASNIIHLMTEQKEELEKQLKELEETSQNRVQTKSSGLGGVQFFPTIKYIEGNGKILYIRELSPCRYLTSFLLAYMNYLKYVKNRTVKMIVVHQRGGAIIPKYDSFTSITQESINSFQLYGNDKVATNIPTKDVMTKLLSVGREDVIIVLDRLYGNADILSGRVKKIFAVSGESDIKRYQFKFGVKVNKCIFPITEQKESLFHIPLIKNYPTEIDLRNAVYNQSCKDRFAILDKELDLV